MAETLKSYKIHSYNDYVWSEISKTVFKIFLAQILMKLKISDVNCEGLPRMAKTAKIIQNLEPECLRLAWDFTNRLRNYSSPNIRKLQIYGINGGGRQEPRLVALE